MISSQCILKDRISASLGVNCTPGYETNYIPDLVQVEQLSLDLTAAGPDIYHVTWQIKFQTKIQLNDEIF